MTIARKLRKIRQASGGSALIEMGLLLPVLVSLMAGMVEFGRALQQFHIADKGVKNAARYLARVAGDGTCPPTSTSWSNHVVLAKRVAQRGSFDPGSPYSLSNWQTASDVSVNVACVDNSAGDFRGPALIPIVTVTTSFSYNDIGILSVLQVPSITISASHQEIYIGG